VSVPTGASEEEHVRVARESSKVTAHLDGRPIVKTVVVPGKLVNFVLG
jgi:leucyl-tRNA synthetase